jgi:hypothetical protein
MTDEEKGKLQDHQKQKHPALTGCFILSIDNTSGKCELYHFLGDLHGMIDVLSVANHSFTSSRTVPI